MTVLDAEVIVGTKHIGGNHGSIATAMLLEIRPVKHTHSFTDSSVQTIRVINSLNKLQYKTNNLDFPPVMNINHSLCVGIAKVRLMRWTVMDLVQRSKVNLVTSHRFTDRCQQTEHTQGLFTMVSSIG